ncbi:ATP-binding protein [Neomegalonema sp.]|uniref:sensor histidine kinase n=1 Tax=Neomegalonema sp. TaxID=2039713 RepID=UPI00261060C8|nr:ATP-binding protein [Neomegalonema sp.]MDD2869963.1 ATP-binding protein [Neomegalonema sp.]
MTPSGPPPSRRALLRLLIVATVGALALAFHLGRQGAEARIAEQAQIAALSRAQALESVMATQRAVAAVLADDGLAREALARPSPQAEEAASRKLERLRAETGSTVIYLLDREGVAVAASNWEEEVSFVGQDYSFRAYFSEAMEKGLALEFALGSVSRRPGLYLSHDLREGARILGVVVVKMEFDALEEAWARGSDRTYVTDGAGLVALSSDPSTRFGAPPDLRGFILARRPVQGAEGWSLTLAAPEAPAWRAGLLTAAGASGLLLALGALLLRVGRARRRREALERAVEERTRDLTAEMRERRRAEERLERMQADLEQANKLATLGQVTAGIAHEVNQPLATIRLLADNGMALLPADPEEARENLRGVARMSDRIAEIIAHLRGFARKATGGVGPVSVKEAVEASLLLTASRRRAEGGRIGVEGLAPDLRVRAEAVRLEQILVNLLQNAQDAVSGLPDPGIRITVAAAPEEVEIAVSDDGPGLSPAMAAQIFTPFATSKSDGLGLGLVISRDIARDLGGDLTADPPRSGAGATFRLRLPRA